MESILDSTKKVLGLDADYHAFDLDVITFINAAFSTLNQLGVGPDGGFYITDEVPVWSELLLPENQLHLVKTYIYLKVRVLWDPPQTSFLINAMNEQLKEHEWRISTFREMALPPPVTVPEEE